MKNIIKIVTCGDVDSGKSTLLGRLLYNTNNIFEDQLEDLYNASKKYSIQNQIEYGMIFDGLKSEREQQITIDTAHRYFTLNNINIHLFDCPGHIEYIHNFATACYECDGAILVIDSTKGISEQTIKHFEICKLFSINKYIIAISKCELSNAENINNIKNIINNKLKNYEYSIIEVSAITNKNMEQFKELILKMCNSINYSNDMLIHTTGDIDIINGKRYYKYINVLDKFNNNAILITDKIQKINIKKSQKIYNSFCFNNNEYDCPKNSIIVDINTKIIKGNNLNGQLIKFPGFEYTNIIAKNISQQNYNIVNITDNNIILKENIFIALDKKYLNCLLLINSNTKLTVGIFIIQSIDTNYKSEIPKTIWLTGLSGSGKTTIANEFKQLDYINIDGDDIRKILSSDLGLTDKDRLENIRRIAAIAKILNNQNKNVIVSCISKNRNERELARNIIGKEYFYEIYCKCEENERIKRDPKGLYKKYKNKMLTNYETTLTYDYLELDTVNNNLIECIESIKNYVKRN